jgi:hypothetical protein
VLRAVASFVGVVVIVSDSAKEPFRVQAI